MTSGWYAVPGFLNDQTWLTVLALRSRRISSAIDPSPVPPGSVLPAMMMPYHQT